MKEFGYAKEFGYVFKDDALWGEREIIRFRWVLIAAILLLIAYIFSSGEYERGAISLILASFYIFYNSILNLLLKKTESTKWIKYVSATIDVAVLSAHIYNYSYFFAPIAVVTAGSTYLYSILIMLSVLRYDGKLVVYTTVCVILSYNLIYLLRSPYIDPNLISQVASADWAGMMYKSVYFALMGYFLFSIPKMINRLVIKQSQVIDERKNMELKLALEQQKRDLAIQKLQMEKLLNKQLHDQKVLIEEQKNTLEDLNVTKDKLFSIIGHDLRSPFAAQFSLSDLLLKEYDSLTRKEMLEALKSINQSAMNGMQLLTNLLDWAKNQQPLENQESSELVLEPLIIDSLDVLINNIRNKKLNIIQGIEPGLKVNADENMVKTILRNLISNAIKYSYPKGEIIVKAYRNNNEVSIEITDKGVGITEENINQLFSLQESISTLGTENEQGTGLGLILCKELAAKNGGKILVSSQPDKGSTFTLVLPAIATPGWN
jgi:signal transduction histidine kinase